jgi:PTS system nitrogen regulatory IIA component
VKNRQELSAEIISGRAHEHRHRPRHRNSHVRLSSVTDCRFRGHQPCDIIDSRPGRSAVRLLFMRSPRRTPARYYLQTLSYFSTKLKNKELRTALLAAKTSAEAYSLLIGQDA